MAEEGEGMSGVRECEEGGARILLGPGGPRETLLPYFVGCIVRGLPVLLLDLWGLERR